MKFKQLALLILSSSLAYTATSCGDQEVEEGTPDGKSITISVFVNDQKTGDIDTKDLSTKTIEITANEQTTKAIAISEIIQAANKIDAENLNEYLASYKCDYESRDGFRPSSKADRCPPVSCAETVRSYLNPDTGSLFYSDDAPMKNGCYRVDNLSKILMTKIDENATPNKYESYEVEVKVDGKSVGSIDIANMKDWFKQVDGVDDDVVYANDIMAALKVQAELDKTYCDYLGSDGWKPADAGSGDCTEIRSCTFAQSAYIALNDTEKRKLNAPEGPSCYTVKNFKTIEIYTTDPNTK